MVVVPAGTVAGAPLHVTACVPDVPSACQTRTVAGSESTEPVAARTYTGSAPPEPAKIVVVCGARPGDVTVTVIGPSVVPDWMMASALPLNAARVSSL